MSQDAVQPSAPPTQTNTQSPAAPEHQEGFWKLMLGSMGVVYGDIGTSPLYALKTALSHMKADGVVESEVIGIVSLLIWALFTVVSLKYVAFLMRADNKGEGGTLSLMALARKSLGHGSKIIFLLGVTGAALFAGDAVITPAISVLSAVEGLNTASPAFQPYVLPIAVIILVSLFVVQSGGTARVASFFGPVMVVFFGLLALLGLSHISDAPRILTAFDPRLGLSFLFGHGSAGFVTLGLVFLAVTGAEALYGDMGHFGRKPIQVAWLCFVLPSLICNYLGQGALVLKDPEAVKDPFYLMAPDWALIPFVVLATVATVIASQAVITGAFSLSRQAIQLGLLPRLEIQHTSASTEGQIYVPRVNRTLLIGVLLLVFLFRTSDNLANAYGIAVTGTMVVDASLAFFVVWKLWRWPLWLAIPVIGYFLTIDVSFLMANLIKIFEGAWVPLTMGALAMVVMWTWVRGTDLLHKKTQRDSIPTADLIRMLEKSKPHRVAGTAVFLTGDPQVAPSALMHNLKHNKVVHERVVIMNIVTEPTPRVAEANRFEIEKLSEDFLRVTLHFGYMESPRVPAAMALMRKAGYKFDIMTTSFFLGKRTLKPSPASGMPQWQDKLFVTLSKQSANATDFFSIPSDRVVELGAQVTI
ncbi:KUP system potassium uptake protein [Rhodoblastus acidophilus]|uniref:Probable potassium transport system protein Kup n=2 Tax=Alphaproteobacteria TaxID=28211 RepID=A0A212R599_RHOAC|nr:potassium transporter Kup [Rhodoblastus acidophilus]MCW2314870.1 KUP system potassium uptake protein [Rhodoblastus acidophilus]PPQ36492.1 potassium transporter Kup [Rhodoblastus acidophilus]RAI16662.1 potassium transporter Kup [Rhodoblastus acidophilus]SNB67091.1 KUP system potassium uptake protein [Rhodoblastus acidophilus]